MEFSLEEIYNLSDKRLQTFNKKLYDDNTNYLSRKELIRAFIKNASNGDISDEKYVKYINFDLHFNKTNTVSELKFSINREIYETERKQIAIMKKYIKSTSNNFMCRLYTIELDTDEVEDEVGDINLKFEELIQTMKRGDLIENLSVSGYRSRGRYIVDEINNKLVAVELSTEIDGYGNLPPNFLTITEFPIGYFDEANIIDVDNKKESDWHSEIQPRFIDCQKLKLDKLDPKDVFVDIEKDITYTIVNFNNKLYCICIAYLFKDITWRKK